MSSKYLRFVPTIALVLCAVSTVWCYWPGIKGGFLFDDFHNLEQLGAYGGVHDWHSLYTYLHTGMSGPLGRPLSLLSFLLDDNTWPSYAPWFKLTNLWVHLICGLLLCWVNLLILRLMRYEETAAQWMAVFAAACWMLHPLMVSTTLYVVQRMAQLATLFIFASLLGYLHGRRMLEHSPFAAYIRMSFSLAAGTLFAVLAKENGALLPLLVLVLEICLAERMQGRKPDYRWQVVFLWLPSTALLAYLASKINFSPDLWPERRFDQPQRLLSESRILWSYLKLLFLPQIEGQGLFQDGFEISKGWMSPWTTLPAMLGVSFLLIGSIALRKKFPVLCFGMLFFLCGHLIESTVIGLELYFEHRNYLSAAFLYLPVSCFLYGRSKKIGNGMVFLIGVFFVIFLSGMTLKRSELWGDVDKLQLYWAGENMNSPRAQNATASYLIRTGRSDEADAVLQRAIERMPKSAFLNIAYILQRTYAKKATVDDFEWVIKNLDGNYFDAQAVTALRTLVDNSNLSTSPEMYRAYTLKLIDAVAENNDFKNNSLNLRLVPYLKAKIYGRQGDFKNSCDNYRQAAIVSGSIDSVLVMVADSANAGDCVCALDLLDIATKDLSGGKGIRPKDDYIKEIDFLRNALNKTIEFQRNGQ
jgi:tetratricopeptide (TPR) repeat protein